MWGMGWQIIIITPSQRKVKHKATPSVNLHTMRMTEWRTRIKHVNYLIYDFSFCEDDAAGAGV